MFKNFSASALGVTGHQSELIELALTYGFSGMDLNVTELATRAKHKGMPYARRLIDSAGIKLGVFHLPLDWEADEAEFAEDLAKLPEQARAAAEVDCTRCVATVSPAGDKRPYHENFEFHRRRFTEICRVLQPAGVRLGLGFQAAEHLRRNRAFQFIHDLDALVLLVNMIECPNRGVLLDSWDLVVAGGTLETVRAMAPEQIVAVQVAEAPEGVAPSELDQNSRLLPDAEGGRVRVADFLRVLCEKGYDGPVTPKPSRGALPSRRREAIVRQVGESLDRVWRAAGLPSERHSAASAASASAAAEP
jgi:sugar phosphate isomerase/epimerase